MSHPNEPTHMPIAFGFTDPQDAPEDDTCQHCEGSGDDPDIAEARGIFIMCQRCGGTGYEQ